MHITVTEFQHSFFFKENTLTSFLAEARQSLKFTLVKCHALSSFHRGEPPVENQFESVSSLFQIGALNLFPTCRNKQAINRNKFPFTMNQQMHHRLL